MSFRDDLANTYWLKGEHIRIRVGSYRHAITVVCDLAGRQRARFANGDFPYFAYVDLVTPDEQWIRQGTNIVPVLPDGRFIMVIEQRPIVARYPERPKQIELEGRSLSLDDYGPYSSLEFPGGAVNPGESLTSGFLRELREETEVGEQTARVYRRLRPNYPFGCDIALEQFLGVAFLSGVAYSEKVETDGGLTVLALSRSEVERNLRNGVIASGQAALLPWAFYQEVERAREDPHPHLLEDLLRCGYLAVEDLKIAKPKN